MERLFFIMGAFSAFIAVAAGAFGAHGLKGRLTPDMLDVFETGEQDVYEVELDNGMILKCTMKHKFYCADGKEHTLENIIKNNLDILYECIKDYSSNRSNICISEGM